MEEWSRALNGLMTIVMIVTVGMMIWGDAWFWFKVLGSEILISFFLSLSEDAAKTVRLKKTASAGSE